MSLGVIRPPTGAGPRTQLSYAEPPRHSPSSMIVSARRRRALRERALAVEHVFRMADWMGEERADGRHRAMLAALISDILSPTAED
jgi:hypothetical protein